jgi:hypothetical protein
MGPVGGGSILLPLDASHAQGLEGKLRLESSRDNDLN